MEKVKVTFEDNTELAEFEAISKGYRNDVYVTIDKCTFNVAVYSMVRLQQDFESEVNNYGFYSVEANLVLVKEASRKEIVEVVNELFEEGYFNKIKSL